MNVSEYISQFDPRVQSDLHRIRGVFLKFLPEGYEETVDYGSIVYQVPFAVLAHTYNKKPLMYAAFAARKQGYMISLLGCYMDQAQLQILSETLQKTSLRKLDIGKSCIRFRNVDDINWDLIGAEIARHDMQEFILFYQKMRQQSLQK